jgi:hypothetical protein
MAIPGIDPEANRPPNWLLYGPTGPGNLLEVFLRSKKISEENGAKLQFYKKSVKTFD